MRHAHEGPLDRACVGCFEEAEQLLLESEVRSRRFWAIVLAGFVSMLVGVTVLVIWMEVRRYR